MQQHSDGDDDVDVDHGDGDGGEDDACNVTPTMKILMLRTLRSFL